jgi:hypothetical protein
MKKYFLLLVLISATLASVGQEKDDESKMIREVVKLDVDKNKYGPPKTVAQPVVETKGKKGKKKVEEPPPPPPVEEGTIDTTNPFIPAPQAEVLKRAQHWYTLKHPKIKKSNGTNSGQTVSCNVSFPYKQKILNPENDVDGTITMDLVIEAKEGKYRYTIKNIRHKANKSSMSCGDIYAVVPECGSMKVSDKTWKLIKKEAFANAQIVVEDLKEKMNQEVEGKKDDW